MHNPLPAEVVVIELPDGVRYRLPLRPLGPWRWLGAALLLLGTGLCAAPVAPVYQAAAGEGAVWLLVVVPSLVAVKVGIFLWKIGLLFALGHSEIELEGGMLRAIERCGPLRWTWERRTAELRRFFVSEALPQLTPFTSGSLGELGKLCVITPEWKPILTVPKTRPMRLAPGYAREWLVVLAEDLARRCVPADAVLPAPTEIAADPAVAERFHFPAPRAAIPVLEQSPDLSEYEELHERPIGSRIALDESPERLTLIVPPDGTLPHRGWFVTGVSACVIALLASAGMLASTGGAVAACIVIAAIAWVGGALLLVAGLHRARRCVLLEADGERLTVWQSGLLRVRRRQWARPRLADVYVMHYPGSDESNPYWELVIQPHPGAGQPVTLLANRDGAELRWLATLLRRALGCPGHPHASPPAGRVVRVGR